jgi:hypothetical protein
MLRNEVDVPAVGILSPGLNSVPSLPDKLDKTTFAPRLADCQQRPVKIDPFPLEQSDCH